MISSHQEPSTRSGEAVSLLLVAGATPHSGWQRLLRLFERAGCTLPESTLLEEWRASAHGSAALGQSGVAMLHPGSHHRSLRSATKTLLGACLSPVLLSVEDMEARPEFWLDELPESRLLMLHSRPEAALVTAMSEDGSLENALAEWTSAAEAMVQIFRRHRRRVTLLDVECALAAPIDFLRNCKTWFGLNPMPYSAVATASDRTGSDMQYLIAAQMIAQSPRALDLIAELEACSLPIGEPSTSPAVDCAALYARQREEKEQRRLAEEDRARDRLLAEEYAGRLTATECIREEAVTRLREAESRLLEAKDEHGLLAQQLQSTRVALEVATREQRSKSSDNEELLRIQKKLQSDLQSMVAEKEGMESRISELTCTLNERSERIIDLEAKIEAQENVRIELEQDSDLVLRKLHQAQEWLETCHIQLEEAKNNLEIERSGLRSSNIKLEILERKLQFRERRIRYMEESRSWRITAPLRNSVKFFLRRAKVEADR